MFLAKLLQTLYYCRMNPGRYHYFIYCTHDFIVLQARAIVKTLTSLNLASNSVNYYFLPLVRVGNYVYG